MNGVFQEIAVLNYIQVGLQMLGLVAWLVMGVVLILIERHLARLRS